eukprot:5488456-Amphidinium_carterae.1
MDTAQERDGRSRLSRRRSNLDAHQLEQTRLQRLVLTSRIPQPTWVTWRLRALKRVTQQWILDLALHCKPVIRHLEGDVG